MSEPFDQVIDGLLAEYRSRRAQATELQRRIREITASATAPRQAVRVKVGAQGEALDIEFPTGAYRRMPPAELAQTLMSTLAQARATARATLIELVTAEISPGFARLMQGDTDLSELLPDEPMMPDVVREYVNSGRPGTATGVDELPRPGGLLAGDGNGQ